MNIQPQLSVFIMLLISLLTRFLYGEEKATVIQHVVKITTSKPIKQKQITLFLRLPSGVTEGRQIDGVMAKCVLADRVEDIEKSLHEEKLKAEDFHAADAQQFAFADKHKLALIVWGSTRLWDSTQSYDELTRKELQEYDQTFDIVANAWDRGVQQLCIKYKLPQKNFLLHGQSGAAQWAHRLALRKPDRFSAIHVHINSSYDLPTNEAKKCFWLITTGELEQGYPAAKRFYAQCQKLGYPIIFKAAPNLGHQGSWEITNLGLRFFEYAISIIKGLQNSPTSTLSQPFNFAKPPYLGDYINNEVYSIEKANFIPPEQRVPIPTRELAEAWGDLVE